MLKWIGRMEKKLKRELWWNEHGLGVQEERINGMNMDWEYKKRWIYGMKINSDSKKRGFME